MALLCHSRTTPSVDISTVYFVHFRRNYIFHVSCNGRPCKNEKSSGEMSETDSIKHKDKFKLYSISESISIECSLLIHLK